MVVATEVDLFDRCVTVRNVSMQSLNAEVGTANLVNALAFGSITGPEWFLTLPLVTRPSTHFRKRGHARAGTGRSRIVPEVSSWRLETSPILVTMAEGLMPDGTGHEAL